MDTIINLASQPVLIKDVSNIIDFEAIDKLLLDLPFKPNMLNEISIDKNIFDRAEFINAKHLLEDEAKQFLNNFQIGHQFENLIITNSWANITNPGQQHHRHSHHFSVVSGVIYLDDNIDNLNFSIEVSIPQIPCFIKNDSAIIPLSTIIGTQHTLKHHLILFLSNTDHLVKESQSVRRSLAFNTFWKGQVGDPQHELGRFTF